MDWTLIGMIFLLMIIYAIMKVGNSNFKGPTEKEEIVEYQAEKLILKVYYGRGTRSATADLKDFEKDGIIWVVAFMTQPVENEVQRKMEGQWADAGKAIVRIRKDTDEVVSWTYIR